MLQDLLRERFKFAFHIEKKESEGYALVVGKNGARLKPSTPDPMDTEGSASLQSAEDNVGEGPARSKISENKDGSSTADMGKRGTLTVKFDQQSWTQRFEVSKVTMEELAGRLSICLGDAGHKVADETGLKGTYQVAYDCPMPRPHRPRVTGEAGETGMLPSNPDNGPSLVQSLNELGLKLEKRKVTQDFYVVDHIEQPAEN